MNKLLSVVAIFLSMVFMSGAYAEDKTRYVFEIDEGLVMQTGSFCAPPGCETVTAKLSGKFSALISADKIMFSDVKVKTDPDLGFTLPADPDLDQGGTTRDIRFSFNGNQIKVEGIINQSAFDGPVTEYEFVATVVDSIADEFNPRGFFTARPDFRRCIYPLCGGYFVKKVNRLFTRCADGSYQSECYVAEINWKALSGDEPGTGAADLFNSKTPYLLQGKLKAKEFDYFGKLGVFHAKQGYAAATRDNAKGVFVGVQNNGILCITSPCFSYDEYILNTNRMKTLSQVDLEKVNAPADKLEEAYKILASGGVLLAAGKNVRTDEFAGPGVKFVARQFYLPVKPF